MPLTGRELYRVYRRHAGDGTDRTPWWFASQPDPASDGGRFDLPAPAGTCYFAASKVAALLEALQDVFVTLPRTELRARAVAVVHCPDNAPDAADLTNPTMAGFGVTAAVWSGPDRDLTQQWAAALRRDGWWALHAGIQHDPAGEQRAVALFDHSNGEHPPTHEGEWHADIEPADTPEAARQLAAYGITVRDEGNLPFVDG